MSYTWPVLTVGSFTAEVGNWQRFLVSLGFTLRVDERFGPVTAAATSSFQERNDLARTGELDAVTRGSAVPQGFVPLIQARHYSQRVHPRDVTLLVIHTMEVAHDSSSAAVNVGAWFGGPSSPMASAHYGVDRANLVQYVREEDVAWHVQSNSLDTGNTRSIGIEHAGFAGQAPEDWADESGVAILERSADLVGELCHRYAVPPLRLSPADVVAGMAGICGHVDVTLGYHVQGGHTDPGAHFPWDYFLGRVSDQIQLLEAKP